mgnify:FL=1|tara:strand:+ start:1209 stop:1673 length:465 start_codon:yes stop_codon:yes gene_type:complete
MADLSKHFEGGLKEPTDDRPQLEEGRYNLIYSHTEHKPYQNGGSGLKLHFKVEDTNITVGALFTVEGSEKAKQVAEKSLYLLAKAAGIDNFSDTDLLAGRTVSCDLKRNDNGYLEIDDNYGSNWEAAILPGVGKVHEPKASEKKPEAKGDVAEW